MYGWTRTCFKIVILWWGQRVRKISWKHTFCKKLRETKTIFQDVSFHEQKVQKTSTLADESSNWRYHFAKWRIQNQNWIQNCQRKQIFEGLKTFRKFWIWHFEFAPLHEFQKWRIFVWTSKFSSKCCLPKLPQFLTFQFPQCENYGTLLSRMIFPWNRLFVTKVLE